MSRTLLSAVAALSSVLLAAAPAGAQDPPRGSARDVVAVTARVEQVNSFARSLTLKTADGAAHVVYVGPELAIFRELKTGDNVLDSVLAHINAARTGAGLSPLTLDANLSKASALHNQLMINGCGLQHQCSGESGLGERFSAQGVKWSSAGENIGFGSSGSSDAQIIKAANGLTDSMLAEKPPNDGHRKNLLNTGFKRIGLSIVRDSKGVTWMTQDFVN